MGFSQGKGWVVLAASPAATTLITFSIRCCAYKSHSGSAPADQHDKEKYPIPHPREQHIPFRKFHLAGGITEGLSGGFRAISHSQRLAELPSCSPCQAEAGALRLLLPLQPLFSVPRPYNCSGKMARPQLLNACQVFTARENYDLPGGP